jgi:hypothetical protein
MSASALPGPRIPVVDANGLINAAWYRYFVGLEKNANTAVSGEIVAGDGLSGGGVISDGVTLSIGSGEVSNAMLRDGLSTSVMGRFQGSGGPVADIQALADNRVLIRDAGQLVFKDVTLIPAVVADGDYGDIVVTGTGTAWAFDSGVVSAFARTFLDDANGAAVRTTIGAGTVTTVSVTTANGVSGSVATATSTPAITLTLGAITPTSVAASGTVTASNLSGTNTGDQTITLTGNVTGSGTGSFATTIAAGVVTLAMQANMATASVVYRKTAGSGAPEVQTLATLKTDLGLTGTNSGDQTITLTGNVTGSGTGSFATTIAAGVVTLAMQANMATASVVYRKTAGAGAPEVQTLATLKTDLGLTGTNSGDQTTSGTASEISVATGSTNPVISLPAAITLTGKTMTGGTFNSLLIGSGSFAGGVAAIYGSATLGTVLTSKTTGGATYGMYLATEAGNVALGVLAGTENVQIAMSGEAQVAALRINQTPTALVQTATHYHGQLQRHDLSGAAAFVGRLRAEIDIDCPGSPFFQASSGRGLVAMRVHPRRRNQFGSSKSPQPKL